MNCLDAPAGQLRQAFTIDSDEARFGVQTFAAAAGAGKLAHELQVVAARSF
jgi:hypothetical protein